MTLEAQALSLARGGALVLEGVDCALREGEVSAICGPNGAGKSSLLMALCALIAPQSGAVRLDGADLRRIAPRERARQIGYLPQAGEVAWDLSVENLVRLGRLAHRDRGDHAVEAAIEAFALAQLRHRPTSELSGGERARALLARVAAGEPRWILADEPFGALDLKHQLALIGYFKSLAREGRGVVLVVHDLAMAMNHADRVIVLGKRDGHGAGRVVADGASEEALSEAVIGSVWGVAARWIGEPGARALLTR